jgi:Leucine Rich repeat
MIPPQGLAGLRELDLCGNQIRGRGALAVARAVAQLPHLDSLQLDENEISDAAIAAIRVRMLDAQTATWLVIQLQHTLHAEPRPRQH